MTVIGFVLAVLLVVELGIRVSGSRLSKDLATIQTFPTIAASLDGPQAEGRLRVLFLGNSLLRVGIDTEIVTHAMSPGSDPSAFVTTAPADGTGLVEWHYGFKNCFAKSGHVPDVLVLGFEGDGGGHLSDSRNTDPAALGYLFCRFSDVPDVMQYELSDFGDRVDFLLGSTSATYANRERVQRRLLDAVIPHYRDSSNRMNDAMVQVPSAGMARPTVATYARLERFLAVTAAHNVRVVIVAIPIPKAYDIDPGLSELAARRNIPLIDARVVPGIENAMYPDGLHMNSAAAEKFSQVVGERLATLCSSSH